MAYNKKHEYDGMTYLPQADYEMRNAVVFNDWWHELDYGGSPGQLDVYFRNIKSKLTGFQVYLPISESERANFILTCAHNFVDLNHGEAIGARFSNMITESDFGIGKDKAHLLKYAIFNANHDEYNDLAIAVPASRSIIVSKGVGNLTDSSLTPIAEGHRICIAGYPVEYKANLYYMEGLIDEVYQNKNDEKCISYKDIQTSIGQIGSPIFLRLSTGKWVIIGIHVYYDYNSKRGYGVVFTEDKMKWIKHMAKLLHDDNVEQYRN